MVLDVVRHIYDQPHRAVIRTLYILVDQRIHERVLQRRGGQKVVDAPSGIPLPRMKAVGPPGISAL